MIINFSAPSKTFLAGEYAVLSGGPALVLSTGPRFTFTAKLGHGKISGLPAGSPAMKWVERQSSLLRDWDLEFSDPHAGKGGFGASSAQFLFVHTLTSFMQISVERALEGLDLKTLLSDYKQLSGGSGADVLAQAVGQIARVAGGEVSSLPWPYPELDFAIVRTGKKIATHEHLAEVSRASLESLTKPAIAVVESFGSASPQDFLQELRGFSNELRARGLQTPDTLKLREDLEKQPWCQLAKGCGAMGADTILVLFAPSDAVSVENYFAAQKLAVVARAKDLSLGLGSGT